jgi:hypothetical protein
MRGVPLVRHKPTAMPLCLFFPCTMSGFLRTVTSTDIPDCPDVDAGRKYNDVPCIDFSASERWIFLLTIMAARLYVSGEFPM